METVIEAVIGLAFLIGVAVFGVMGADRPAASRRESALVYTILGAIVAMGFALVLPSSKDLLAACAVGLSLAFAGSVVVVAARRNRKLRARTREGSR